MARIPYPDLAELPSETREALSKIRSINVFRLLAWAETLAPSLFEFVIKIFSQTKIDPRLRQLAILRVGRICRSPYEIHHHEKLARIVGLGDLEIEATRGTNAVLMLKSDEQAVIRFAEEITRDVKVSEKTFHEVRTFLSERELTELALITSFYSCICRFLETMEIEIEQSHSQSPIAAIRAMRQKFGHD